MEVREERPRLRRLAKTGGSCVNGLGQVVDSSHDRACDPTDARAPKGEVEVEGEDHPEAGGRPRGRCDANGGPRTVVPEELREPRVRPAPVIRWRGMVGHDAVRRREDPAPGGGHAVELMNPEHRAVAVLEPRVA